MTDSPWYRSDPTALAETVREAVDFQPRMTLHDEGDRVCLRGRFEIYHDGVLVEAFAIELELSPESPRAFPTVRELDGRIPRDKDRHHVEGNDGRLCAILPDYLLLHHRDGMTLAEFMAGPLREHLAGQGAVLRGLEWPSGAWGHGPAGVIQFYQEALGEDSLETVYELLRSELLPRNRRRHMDCPCGSGKARRSCHGATLSALGKGPNFKGALLYLDEKLKENDDGAENA